MVIIFTCYLLPATKSSTKYHFRTFVCQPDHVTIYVGRRCSVKNQRPTIIRPGFFSVESAADRRRNEFDYHNEALLYHQQAIDFLFFGDSITHWWDVATFFGHTGNTVANRGIGGDTTGHALRRFCADVTQLSPRHVIILIGINNTWAMDEWLPKDRKTTEEIFREVTSDVEAMMRMALEQQIRPVLCSLLPTRMERYARNKERNELVLRINQAFLTSAARDGAIYVDYHSRMTDPDGTTLREDLADDGLHPHILGYQIMAGVLRDQLASHGIQM